MFGRKANSELVRAYEARILSLESALAIERARVDRLMESVADKAGITVSLPAPLEPVKISGDNAATPVLGTTDSSPAMPDWWRAVAGNNKIATPPKKDVSTKVESQQEKKQ